jgi:uncharacterized SAM-binding protein YcdF (DUF218 family)
VRLLALAPLLAAALLTADLLGIVAGPRGPSACPGVPALVMGAAQYDGRPSPAFERRLARALELYREGCATRIVVSGGGRPGDRSTEGEAGVRWLAAQGVPQRDLAAETTATTSAENVLASRPLLGGGPILVVTDDLHAWRTSWLARRFGLEASAVGVPVREGRGAYALRELAAMAAYRSGWLR